LHGRRDGHTLYDVRVNARIEPPLAKKLAYLKAKHGETTSAILKRALEAYYEKEVGASASPLELLEQAGFVGCASGPTDLSTTYKRTLTKSLGAKVRGHR
jgi:Ribbon-helix-helix protein, copG family